MSHYARIWLGGESYSLDPKLCPVCRALPYIYTDNNPTTASVSVVAKCHESRETLTLYAADISNERGTVAKIKAWLEGLFALDLNPDVRELQLTNRFPRPLT